MGVKLVSASAGSVEIVAPATASNYTATMPAGSGTVAVQGVSTNIVSGTSQASTSGTSIDFTSIPSWVKRITVMFNAVSTNGSSIIQVQLGDAGGVETTGYASLISSYGAASTSNSTTGILANTTGNAGYVLTGIMTIAYMGSNLWVASIATATDPSPGNYSSIGAGRKTLSDTLDRVRITTVNGTDTFDAGSINIMYE